jgi:hypothetical protein
MRRFYDLIPSVEVAYIDNNVAWWVVVSFPLLKD